MRTLTGPQLARVVERHDWTLLRVSGSHHIYGKPGEVARPSIPLHGTKPLKAGLQRHLVKPAGLDDGDLG